jgi:hypothetical protein
MRRNWRLELDKNSLVILLIFGTPALAIVGGIVAAIVKMIGQQRFMELVQRERIAAIEKGLDVSQQPLLVMPASLPARQLALRSVQGLTIGGLVTLALGIGLGLMLLLLPASKGAWPVGLVPAFIGIALLVSARVVRKGVDEE